MRQQIVFLAVAGLAVAISAGAGDVDELTGRFEVVWGDPAQLAEASSPLLFTLRTESGETVPLDLGPTILARAGGLWSIQGAEVRARLGSAGPRGRRAVLDLERVDRMAKAGRDVSGSQPWVSLLCKFSGDSSEPKSLTYFQDMYGSSYPGLDHYWREVSYDTINVLGSGAQPWRTLPHSSSHYASQDPKTGDWSIDLDAMFDDCTAIHDPYVDFRDYVGINMMFNDTFGPWAWGGNRWATLDGQSGLWRVTWEPPWGYDDITVIAHEMGHGFGFPHSNNADGDTDPYDNVWDVMSSAWQYATSHVTYGTLGKHTIAHHKDLAGWIPAADILDVAGDGRWTVILDNLEESGVANYRLVRIPIPSGSTYYTVETRDLIGYDGSLPGNAVIIHEVDVSRSEDAWLVDPVNPGSSGDEGAMWRVGECFDDAANEIEVCVDSATPDGFQVTVTVGDVAGFVFADGFETGSWTSWSYPAVP